MIRRNELGLQRFSKTLDTTERNQLNEEYLADVSE